MLPLFQNMFFQLILTTRPYDTQLNELLATYNLHRTEWAVLTYLMLDENMSLIDIGRILAMDKPNVTRTIKRLVELGYIEIYPSEGDRRRKTIKVKESTRIMYQEMRTIIDAYKLEILEGVSEEEQRVVYSALKKIQENLSKRAGELK